MPRLKPTAEDLKVRKLRAKTWRAFRRDFKLTQRKLAEAIGISRRTIQMIEMVAVKSGSKILENGITPHAATIKKFEIIKNKYESGNF